MLINEENRSICPGMKPIQILNFFGDDKDDPNGPLYADATHLPTIVCMPENITKPFNSQQVVQLF